MIKYIEKYPILSLVAFAVIMLGFSIDALPVSIMEARNFISAREMLSDNNWILTTMNGEARYEKPPLATWITAVFGYIFGMTSIIALRWPALLFFIVIGISSYLFSNKLGLTKSHSLMNGFVVLSSFYVIGILFEAPVDIYTHSFMLIALYQLFIMLQNRKTTILGTLLFVIMIAASILSKGPVSLYVLFLSFIFAYGLTYKYKNEGALILKLLLLLVLGIVLGSWWFIYVRIADPDIFATFAGKEISNWSSYKVKPIYYYWSFFIQSGIWAIAALASLLYPYMKPRVGNLKAYRFTFFWTLSAVILLSIIPEKKSRYLMPVLIPLALNIGFYIDYLVREFKTITNKLEIASVYIQFGIIACIGFFFWSVDLFLGLFMSSAHSIRYILLSLSLFAIGILIFRNLKLKSIKPIFYLVTLLMLCIGFLGLPLAGANIQDGYNSLSNINAKDLKVYGLNLEPEVLYNYGKILPSIKNENGYCNPEEKTFLLLANKDDPQTIVDLSRLYDIEYIDNYDLNISDKGSRGYRNNLYSELYKLTRKRQ